MPQPLQYARPLYIEQRSISTWLGRVAWMLGLMLLALALVESILLFKFWHRFAPAMRGVLQLEICFFVAIAAMGRTQAITVLEPAELQIRFALGGVSLWKRTFHLVEIRSAEPIKGVARSALRVASGQLFFMTGPTNIKLQLDKRTIVIGTSTPEEFLQHLRDAITAAGGAP